MRPGRRRNTSRILLDASGDQRGPSLHYRPGMPEGDTIRLAADRLGPLVGHVPTVGATHPRTGALRDRIAGRAVTAVDARGKHLLVSFEGRLVLHSHLRMTGRWDVHAPGAHWARASTRSWLVLGVPAIEAVQFDGPVLELLTAAQVSLHPALRRLGPDVLADGFDADRAARALATDPSRPVGVALLDQSAIAGIGYVWKCEVLHACGVDPRRAVGTLDRDDLTRIARTAATLMRAHVAGGEERRPAAGYGRPGRACPRCGAVIRSLPQEGRPTTWCPGCQA